MAKRKGRGPGTSTCDPQLVALDEAGRLPVPLWAAQELVDRGLLELDPERPLVAPLILTPTPSEDRGSKHFHEGAWFDVDEVARVFRVLSSLPHTKGRRWAGRPLRPEGWQLLWIVAPVFGWKGADGLRIVRDVWIEIPRKNGKSTLCSGLALVLLTADREPGAEVYAAAGSTDQAAQVFAPAKDMAIRCRALRGKVKPLAKILRVPKTGSFFRVLSKVAETAHGLNVSGAVIDEIHTLKSRDLIDAIETGTGGREQPLIFLITTSDDGKLTTIYAEKREDIEALADDRGDVDHSQYGVVWAAPEDADSFELATLRQANPNIGVSVTEQYLVAKAQRARRSPAFLPVYERLHLNRRRSAIARALDMDVWAEGCNDPKFDTWTELRAKLLGRRCVGGLDLATTQDFAAWCLVFADDDLEGTDEKKTRGGVWLLPRLWIPEHAAESRKALRNTLRGWNAAGWVTITPGNVIDFDRVRADIEEDDEAFRIEEFAFDKWQAESLRQQLLNDVGLVGWPCQQTMERLAPATQEVERLLGLHLVRTGGNPALEWMASNVVARADAAGRWRPEKNRSAEKIDGFVAACMGVASLIRIDRERRGEAAVAAGGQLESDFFRPTGRLSL